MNRRSLLWGMAFIIGAIVVGLNTNGQAPRIGMTVLLASFGVTLILASNAEWFLRRTTNPDDYKGSCPVGESCPKCGAFNYKPRRSCRSCKGPVNGPETDVTTKEAL